MASKKIARVWFFKFKLKAPRYSFKYVRTILIVMKILGVFPHTTTSKGVKSGGKLNYALATMFFSLFSMLFGLAIASMQFIRFDLNTFEKWNYTVYAVTFMALCLLYAPILLDFLNSVHRNGLTISFFERLEGYDEETRRLGYYRERNILIYWIFIVIYAVNALLSFCGMYVMKTQDPKSVSYIPSTLLHLVNSSLALKWIIYVCMIRERFEHLNSTILKKHLSKLPTISNDRACRMTPEKIGSLHANLVSSVGIFNQLASLSLLCSFAALLTSTLLNFRALTFQPKNSMLWQCCITSFLQIIVFCWFCNTTANKANDIGKRLFFQNILNDTSNKKINENLAIQLFHNKIAFSGGDMFDIDLATLNGTTVLIFSFGIILSGFN